MPVPVQQFVATIGTFLTLLAQLPPPNSNNFNQLHDFIQMLIPILLLISSLPNAPPSICRIMQRLDPGFCGFQFQGKNVFDEIKNQRYLFWLNTGELTETMLDITTKVSANMSRINRRGGQRQRKMSSKLNNVNKVLLTFLWLRKYPCLDTLALMFDVSPSTVTSIIHSVIPILWRHFQNQVSWPSLSEWNALRGNWRLFPDAVGCIDGTPHEIYRPEAEPQQEFFSGHRHYHLMNTQLIVDNLGNIVFLQAGFLGSLNDAANYNLMERVGPGTNYDMPLGVVILADKGYSDVPPLLTPFRAAQIRRLPRNQQRLARRFNQQLSRCRIIVEHTIKHVKTYRSIGSIWRHPRWFQPIVVELCTFLAQRHVVLFDDL